MILPVQGAGGRGVSLAVLCGSLLWLGSAARAADHRLVDDPTFSFQLVESWPVEVPVLNHPEIPDVIPTWTEAFSKTEQSIDMAQFYLSDAVNEPLEPLMAILKAKAGAGVPVRILVDKKMTPQYQETLEMLGATKGLELRMYDTDALTHGIHHAKYFCLDGETCYVGSQNFDWRSLKHIHELGVLVKSARLAAEFERVFAFDWAFAAGKRKQEDKKADVPTFANSKAGLEYFYPVLSPPILAPGGFMDALPELVRLIDATKKSLKIEVMSYSPVTHGQLYDDTIDRALRRAAQRNVAITLLVSHWNLNKPGIFWLKSLAVLPNVTIKVSTIPRYSKGFVPFARVNHAKYALFDDSIAWVGTSNWSTDYFTNSRDIELVFKDKTWVPRLVEKFEAHQSAPFVQNLDVAKDYPAPQIK